MGEGVTICETFDWLAGKIPASFRSEEARSTGKTIRQYRQLRPTLNKEGFVLRFEEKCWRYYSLPDHPLSEESSSGEYAGSWSHMSVTDLSVKHSSELHGGHGMPHWAILLNCINRGQMIDYRFSGTSFREGTKTHADPPQVNPLSGIDIWFEDKELALRAAKAFVFVIQNCGGKAEPW